MSLKRVLILSSGGPPVWWSGFIYAILKECIMGNIHVNYIKFGPVVQKEMSYKEKVYARTNGRTTDGQMTDDGQRLITIAPLEPSAQVS